MVAAGQVTYYARKTFNFAGTVPPSLELLLKADDGAAVYLNGVEVLRDNLPDGPITASTPAAGWRSGSAEDFQSHMIPAAALVQGENVIAVEVHNIWRGNNDLGFDLALSGGEVAVEVPQGPLVEVGSTWGYADSANGSPAGWPRQAVGGVASTAQFGFGEGDEVTVLAGGQEAYSSPTGSRLRTLLTLASSNFAS